MRKFSSSINCVNSCMVCREVPEGYKVLTEGKGSILQQGNEVFYNPAQVCLYVARFIGYV